MDDAWQHARAIPIRRHLSLLSYKYTHTERERAVEVCVMRVLQLHATRAASRAARSAPPLSVSAKSFFRVSTTQRSGVVTNVSLSSSSGAYGAVRVASARAMTTTASAEITRSTGRPERSVVMTSSPENNVTEHIYSKMGIGLHANKDHPLGLLKSKIHSYFKTKTSVDGSDETAGRSEDGIAFYVCDDLCPLVAISANFDEILIPKDHVSRSPNDTFYVDDVTCLRCHTSAHQTQLLREGHDAFLVTGDVYRRDTIDATHYPVFHQMEGVRVFSKKELSGIADPVDFCVTELKRELEGLARHLFGEVEMRWVDAYFPFTDPSLELEIFFNGEWLEVLGCGVMQQQILDANGREGDKAWAFGLGLERLAMILFDIPDIRLFWSDDKRFTSQFKEGNMNVKFVPYSKFPPVFKDMSFWTSEKFTENNLCSVVRDVAGDLAEEVKLIDAFTHPKTGKESECYRITYRSMERSLTNEEVDALQEVVRSKSVETLGVELR